MISYYELGILCIILSKNTKAAIILVACAKIIGEIIESLSTWIFDIRGWPHRNISRGQTFSNKGKICETISPRSFILLEYSWILIEKWFLAVSFKLNSALALHLQKILIWKSNGFSITPKRSTLILKITIYAIKYGIYNGIQIMLDKLSYKSTVIYGKFASLTTRKVWFLDQFHDQWNWP